MTLFNRDARSRLMGTVAVTLFQLLVLFAIGVAVVRYLEWSSDAAQAEFTRAIEAASDPSYPSIPNQTVKARTGCDRKDSANGAR
jgi:hypothetical protein